MVEAVVVAPLIVIPALATIAAPSWTACPVVAVPAMLTAPVFAVITPALLL